MTSWFRSSEKTQFIKSMQHVRREKSGQRS